MNKNQELKKLDKKIRELEQLINETRSYNMSSLTETLGELEAEKAILEDIKLLTENPDNSAAV